ncbi:MAG: MBL fold metallo-hydrolase [Oscillospiraceae bacterium]|nr:MBL fold metallo-hydrolase [Oscillospiraceae bacterium]
MKEMAPHIYQAHMYSGTEHMRSANVYLVHAQPRSLLIDAGYNNEVSQQIVLEMLQTLHIPMTDLDVFITHNHPDHAGMAQFLQQNGARIYMKQEERNTCAILCTYWCLPREQAEHRLHTYGFSPAQRDRLLERAFAPDYQYHRYNWTDFPVMDVSVGQLFSYGEYTFEVVPLTGHTRYQVGLVEREHKWLFCGDTLSRNEVLIISTMAPGQQLLERHLHTLERLKQDYNDFWIVSGHCNPFYGTERSVENTKRYFDHISSRIQKTVENRSAPMTLQEISNEIFRYKEGRMVEDESLKLHFRISNALACLERLTDQGKLQMETKGDIWYWKGASG